MLLGNPLTPDFRLIYRIDEREFLFDTAQIRQPLGNLPLNEPDILDWIGQYVEEGLLEVQNG